MRNDPSKRLTIITNEFAVYPAKSRQPLFVRFTIHLAYIQLHKNRERVLFECIQTNCVISNYAKKWKGSTICGPDDEYDEVTGMKIALTRAVRGMDYHNRSQIWAAFHRWREENYA